MWGWHMDGDWGWWMFFGWIWMVVFWGLIIWAVVTLVSRLGPRDQPPPGRGESALDILERRYAAGDIDHEEFEERRRRLRGG